jgi:hypothetical protein
VRPIGRSRDGDTSALEQPSGTRFGSSYLFAGNTTRVFEPGARGQEIVLKDADGRLHDVPEAARAGVLPQIAASGDTLYLVWGEAAGEPGTFPNGRQIWPPAVRNIWFTARNGTGQWSAPVRLARADQGVPWGAAHTTVTRSPDGVLNLALAAGPNLLDAQLVHARFFNGTASTAVQPFVSPIYLRMAWHGDRGLIAFVTWDRQSSEDLNSVFVSRWEASSRRWLQPQIVNRSGGRAALATKLIATDDGVFHLIWGQSLDPGTSSDVVRHISSADGGRTWSVASDLATPGVRPAEILRAGPSTVGVLFESFDNNSPRIMIACWNNGWRQPRPISSLPLRTPRIILDSPRTFIALQRVAGNPPRFMNVLLETR